MSNADVILENSDMAKNAWLEMENEEWMCRRKLLEKNKHHRLIFHITYVTTANILRYSRKYLPVICSNILRYKRKYLSL